MPRAVLLLCALEIDINLSRMEFNVQDIIFYITFRVFKNTTRCNTFIFFSYFFFFFFTRSCLQTFIILNNISMIYKYNEIVYNKNIKLLCTIIPNYSYITL